jgi:small subunit ribosomal protein S18
VARLQKYVTDTGKILPRRATGMCAKHQRRLCTAIKRAREIALLPFSAR